MGDTAITIICIALGAILIFVFPLMTMADRVDTAVQTEVSTLTTEFVNEVRTTGMITQESYNSFLEKLAATGNIYDPVFEIKILDENPGKKTIQTQKDKIGENVYYSVYKTQIEDVLESDEYNHCYMLKEGDMLTVTLKNTNLTMAQQLKNFMYLVVGNDTYTICANSSAMIIGNGNAVAQNIQESEINPELVYTLYENDASGKVLMDSRRDISANDWNNTLGWTNENVCLVLSSVNNYELELNYYLREKINGNNDYVTNYSQLDGNSANLGSLTSLQAFWKHSKLDKYSDVKDINIKIDRGVPVIGGVQVSSEFTPKVQITNVKDLSIVPNYESGINSYYYVFTDSNVEPNKPDKNDTGWKVSGDAYSTELVKTKDVIDIVPLTSQYNGKYCWVWVKDNAGNVSAPVSVKIEGVKNKITRVEIDNLLMRNNFSQKLVPVFYDDSDNKIDDNQPYKTIAYMSSDSNIVTIDENTGVIKSKSPGVAKIICKITNIEDDSEVSQEFEVTVADMNFSITNGSYIIDTDNGYSTLKSTISFSGIEKVYCAWSDNGEVMPSDDSNLWEKVDSNNYDTIYEVNTKKNVFLWGKAQKYGQTIYFRTDNFSVTDSEIVITPENVTTLNPVPDLANKVKCTITYPLNTIKESRKVAFGTSRDLAFEEMEKSVELKNVLEVTQNGYVVASAYDSFGNRVYKELAITNIVEKISKLNFYDGDQGMYIGNGMTFRYNFSGESYGNSSVIEDITNSEYVDMQYYGKQIYVKGKKEGTATIRVTLTNYDGTKVFKDRKVEVVSGVARIGEVHYSSLQDAVDVGGNIVLLKNVATCVTVSSGKTVEIDLNGKIWSGNNGKCLENKGICVLKNTSSTKGKIVVDTGNFDGFNIVNTGSLTIQNNIEINRTISKGGCIKNEFGILKLKGSVNSLGENSISVNLKGTNLNTYAIYTINDTAARKTVIENVNINSTSFGVYADGPSNVSASADISQVSNTVNIYHSKIDVTGGNSAISSNRYALCTLVDTKCDSNDKYNLTSRGKIIDLYYVTWADDDNGFEVNFYWPDNTTVSNIKYKTWIKYQNVSITPKLITYGQDSGYDVYKKYSTHGCYEYKSQIALSDHNNVRNLDQYYIEVYDSSNRNLANCYHVRVKNGYLTIDNFTT